MIARLSARGVRAPRIYELVPEALMKDTVERLQQAARTAGATRILSTAVIGQERETVVYPDPLVYGVPRDSSKSGRPRRTSAAYIAATNAKEASVLTRPIEPMSDEGAE